METGRDMKAKSRQQLSSARCFVPVAGGCQRAPLTTTVMDSVSQNDAGAASGIDNAISRIAGLLAMAALGFVLITVFNRHLDQSLNTLPMISAIRQQIDSQRFKLAAIQTTNSDIRRAIAVSFVAGYRSLLWIAACTFHRKLSERRFVYQFEGKRIWSAWTITWSHRRSLNRMTLKRRSIPVA